MKELLDFIKKLYDDGLIDPEFLTTTDVDRTKKMTSDKQNTPEFVGSPNTNRYMYFIFISYMLL